WREFLATVLTKGLLLGMLLPPILMAGVITLMPVHMNAAAPRTVGTIAVIDRSEEVGEALKKSLSAETFKSRRAKRLEEGTSKPQRKGINLPMDDRTKAITSAQMEATAATLSVEILPADTDVETAKKPILSARLRDGE